MTAERALKFQAYRGAEIAAVLEPLGALRIAVFRAFPYLYEGDLAYEMDYLQTYVGSAGGFLYTAWDGPQLVGATTCIPLTDETAEVQQPFLEAGMVLKAVCYFGESILLPAYRGLGIGHRFFDAREAHARSLGCAWASFCAVDRPADHPARPADYRPLDAFWLQRGYERKPKMQSQFIWREIGEAEASPKTLTYWMKAL
jgi:GNAT superfamily N-acetyltransferase